MAMSQDRFRGRITGVGTSSGTRLVVGDWESSPLGAFFDVMVATPDSRRVLLAPSRDVADYVAATYSFDEIRVASMELRRFDTGFTVAGDDLTARIDLGSRTALGVLLRLVPYRLATSTYFAAAVDPIARIVMPGVRTRGSAGGGRREYYGATDLRAVTAVSGRWEDTDLGELRDVDPPPRFGFSSTPRRPGCTSVVTTVVRPAG